MTICQRRGRLKKSLDEGYNLSKTWISIGYVSGTFGDMITIQPLGKQPPLIQMSEKQLPALGDLQNLASSTDPVMQIWWYSEFSGTICQT